MQLSPALLALLRGESERRSGVREPSNAALRNPHRNQGVLTSRTLVLTERTHLRGGAKSRRRTARVWDPA